MRQLVLATHNLNKAREIEALLRDLPTKLVRLDQFPHVGKIEEDQDTLEENALKKAREVFKLTTLPSLADDSGLEVYFLNGEPGVHSSRYAGPRASDEENCKKLLAQLQGVPPRRRAARFGCVLALVGPDMEEVAEGICRGIIVESPRGKGGFGYDPIFQPEGYKQTFAEMPVDLKNSLSHRAKAVEKLRPVLSSYFRQEISKVVM